MTARKSIDLRRRENRLRRGGPVKSGLDNEPKGEDALALAIGDTPSPEFAAVMAEEFLELLACIGDKELQAIALGRMEGYSNEELALRLDCSQRTIERRLRLIREKLERKFGDD